MVRLQRINPRWSDRLCIVAGSGPSLTADVAAACRGHRVVAVNDAWRLMPFAEVLYACDSGWWDHHEGCPGFAGERWSSHGDAVRNDKRRAAERHALNLVRGAEADWFSRDPGVIHYGEMGGFQAANLAAHMMGWRGRLVLVGFNMQPVAGVRHFFGEHPERLRSTVIGPRGAYAKSLRAFALAAAGLPDGFEIVNATPDSALTCFPMMELAAALAGEPVQPARSAA